MLSYFIISNPVTARIFCPRGFPGKNTGVGCRALLQGIFPTQGSNPHCFTSPALAGRFFTTGKPNKTGKPPNARGIRQGGQEGLTSVAGDNGPQIKCCSGPSKQILKARPKRIKMLPSNLTKSQNNIQEPGTQQAKRHDVCHEIKNYYACKEAGKNNSNEKKCQSTYTNSDQSQILELAIRNYPK